MAYIKKITGKKCYLSPIRMEDAEKYTEWFNDIETTMNLNATTWNLTVETEKKEISKWGINTHVYGIVNLATDTLIGNCGLSEINMHNRSAVLGIMIGNKEYWNKGYGEEATNLILDYGFNILNLHSVLLDVFEYNKRAIRCYEKCGFKEAGRRRESKFFCGKYYDTVSMDILESEFKKSSIKNFLD